MHSHSLLLTNERLAQLTIANEQAKASGETEPSGGTLFCALAMRSLMRMLKMSPQCQQLQLMAFASESKQHSETPEDICAFVCRNDLRDPAICERQKENEEGFCFLYVSVLLLILALFLSSSFCSALYPCQQWCLHKGHWLTPTLFICLTCRVFSPQYRRTSLVQRWHISWHQCYFIYLL